MSHATLLPSQANELLDVVSHLSRDSLSLIPSTFLDKGSASLLEIGTGYYSRVYGFGLGHVLKITCDAAHAQFAKNCERDSESNPLLPKVVEVVPLGEVLLANGDYRDTWAIIQERLSDIPESLQKQHPAYIELLTWTCLYTCSVEESLSKLELLGFLKDTSQKEMQSERIAEAEPLWQSLEYNTVDALASLKKMARLPKRVFAEVTDLLFSLQDILRGNDAGGEHQVLFDLHRGNILYRGTQPVAVDPLCSFFAE